jgi:plastocyanin
MAVNIPSVRRWSALALAPLLMAGTLAACGGSSNDDTSSKSNAAASSALTLAPVETGEDDFTFTKKTLTAKAGTVTIKLANGSSNEYPHAIAIEGNGVDKDGEAVQPGGTSTVTAELESGTYTFYCPVGEHEKYGMKGTLTVQ